MDTSIDHTTGIQTEAARISELIRANDLSTPVEHLGRWKVRDVAAHLGGVHRWATRIVVSRTRDGPSFTKSKLQGSELCDWFDAGVEELTDALQTNDAQDACPNFCPGSVRTVQWWSRRQLHETTVHRWDVERALGCTTPIAGSVGADGVDEFLDVFVRTRGKQTLSAPLVLTSMKPSHVWTMIPAEKPGRIDITPGKATEATAEISGAADQLMLALWGRLSFADAGLKIEGDERVAHSFMQTS